VRDDHLLAHNLFKNPFILCHLVEIALLDELLQFDLLSPAYRNQQIPTEFGVHFTTVGEL
jgi:hypothetical protein